MIGETLTNLLCKDRNDRWHELIDNTDMTKSCRYKALVPKTWRKAKVVALPKPGKDYKDPKSYRSISVLCHTFKLYGRMIMNRIKVQVERKLIVEQASFRPRKIILHRTGTKLMSAH